MSASWENLAMATGLEMISFIPIQRRVMPKNVQTTAQLHSLHRLAKLHSKSFKLGFSNMRTKNFKMYNLGFEETEEPEIKLPTFVGIWKKQRICRKTCTFALLTMIKPLTMWIITNWKILNKIRSSRPPYLSPENLYVSQKAIIREISAPSDIQMIPL